jgi:hypothetical protein
MNSIDPILIAPCGLNCRLCYAYIREKNHCPGCRGDDTQKMKSCLACRIKACQKLAEGSFQHCCECDTFPCDLLKRLDKRYRTRYAASPVANLIAIRDSGVESLLLSEVEQWTCLQCGEILSMHKPACLSCGTLWHLPEVE